MSNIIMIHKAGPFGDCTDLYDLRLESRTTVKEFIDEVLARKGEWGYIDIEDRRLEYRYGKLLSGQFDDIKECEIIPVSAHGGWSRMDYELRLNDD